MSLRFKVGEVAILAPNEITPRDLKSLAGRECEIIAIGYVDHIGPLDYHIRIPGIGTAGANECVLRKRPHPGIPESVRSWFEVKLGAPA